MAFLKHNTRPAMIQKTSFSQILHKKQLELYLKFVTYLPPHQSHFKYPSNHSSKSRNEKHRIILADQLDDDSFRSLLRHGLYQRCGDICQEYERTSAEIEQRRQEVSADFSANAVKGVVSEENDAALAQELLEEKAQELYPYVPY